MKTILFILSFTIASFAAADCAAPYSNMYKLLETQEVIFCRVTGIGESRTDIMGIFFNFKADNNQLPAVFLYGDNYPEMLYIDNDWVVTHAECIEDGNYRSFKSIMTPEQLLDMLFQFKNCGDDFKIMHSASKGKLYI